MPADLQVGEGEGGRQGERVLSDGEEKRRLRKREEQEVREGNTNYLIAEG